jgi:serine/threonine protein kinase
VTWKALRHPNVMPLLGVTMTENRFVMVSEWMENGNINEFVKTHTDVNRLELVCFLFEDLIFACH